MAVRYLLFVIALSFIGVQLGVQAHKLKLLKLDKIKEDSSLFQSDLQIKQDEDVSKISGHLKQLVTVDNEWKVHFVIKRAPKADEDYRVIMTNPSMGVCEIMGSYYKNFFYEKLKQYSNAPHPDACPLPPEHYHLRDYPFDGEFKKALLPGYYRIDAELLKDGVAKMAYEIELVVE